MQLRIVLFYIFLSFFALAACRKDQTISSNVVCIFQPKLNSQPISLNTFIYQTLQGDTFKITNLEFYLSNFTIDGQELKERNNNYLYFSAAQGSSKTVDLSYTGALSLEPKLTFFHGISPVQNVPNGLINNTVNNAMQWPDVLGGGYHFMKYEGRYLKSGVEKAFAIHLGKNGNQLPFQTIITNGRVSIVLNLDSLLSSVHTIDLNTLPGSIMDNDSIQNLFKENMENSIQS